jgi:hypothetical protein
MMEVDRPARLHNQDRLYALSRDRGDQVSLFCSHDAVKFKALSDASRFKADQSQTL